VTLAVYPGSFDPPTVAHLAIARAALDHVRAVRFVLSKVALGKEDAAGRTPALDRLRVLEEVVSEMDEWSAAMTSERLVVDIAREARADAVVVGTDKWAQLVDPRWYAGDSTARDAAMASLPPRVLLAPRPGVGGAVPTEWPGIDVVVLDIERAHGEVSATRARTGEPDLMADAARRSGLWPAS
jgi:hypothetical protein